LIDKKFKPFLLEVNHAPSFNDDTEVDKHVKTELITDTLRLLNITYASKQRALDFQRKALENNQLVKRSKEEAAAPDSTVEADEERLAFEKYQLANLGDYQRIYPFPHTEEDGSTEEERGRWQTYEAIREHAKEVWVKQTGLTNIKAGQEKKEAS
jgi:hypothetical protein